MRYFTRDLVQAVLSDEDFEKAFSDYQEYENRIRPKLPRQMQRLFGEISLHDGIILNVLIREDKKDLTLTLRAGDLQVGYFTIEIHYTGVKLLKKEKIKLQSIAKNKKLELLYDEIYLMESGRYEHSIIFHPVRDIKIECENITFNISNKSQIRWL
jgi:hypothetical protein